MSFYAMSKMDDTNIIDNIVSEGFFVEDLDHCEKYESFRFYTEKFNRTPIKSLYLVTDNIDKYIFSIRHVSFCTYLISKDFLDILKSLSIEIKLIIPVTLVDKNNHDNKLINEYFYIEPKNYSYKEVFNFNESSFNFEYENSISGINNLSVASNFEFIVVTEFQQKINTPICSENFKNLYDSKKLKGVNFIGLNKAKWENGDVMASYFNSLIFQQEVDIDKVKPI